MLEWESQSARIFLVKDNFSIAENWSRETFTTDSVLKTNHWTYRMKDLNWEKIVGSFHEKELLQSIL